MVKFVSQPKKQTKKLKTREKENFNLEILNLRMMA